MPVYLKKTACCAFSMVLDRNKDTSMVFSDYGLLNGGEEKDIHLLEYHEGRVRDNLDLGFVYAFSIGKLREISLDETVKFSALYDVRLKVSEKYELRKISNRFNGNLYTVEKSETKQNVFDYLQDDKASQLEKEAILTNHLKRIGAYLAPKDHYQSITQTQKEGILVSIIIPVFKRPEFIGAAIESALEQTNKNIEIIVVVNGGNSDPTTEVVKKYMEGGELFKDGNPPVKLIILDVNNIGFCLNMGITHAKGKYYLQLDSDDRLKENAVEYVLKTFDENPNAGMVIGSYEVWEKKGEDIVRMEDIPVVKHEEWTEDNGRNNLLRINGAGAPRAFNIEVVKELGLFGMNDEPYSRNYGEDYEMVLKLSEKYRVARIWEPIYKVIRHKGGTDHMIDQNTVDRNDNAKDMMRLNAIKRRKSLSKDK